VLNDEHDELLCDEVALMIENWVFRCYILNDNSGDPAYVTVVDGELAGYFWCSARQRLCQIIRARNTHSGYDKGDDTLHSQ